MLFGSQQTPQRRDSGKKSAAREAGTSRNWQSVILTALSFTQAPAPAQGNEHRPPGSGCTAPCPFHGFRGENGEARGSLPLLLSSSSSSRGRPRGGQSLRARTATGDAPVSPFPSLFPTCFYPCLPAPTVRGAAAPPEPPPSPQRTPTGLLPGSQPPVPRRGTAGARQPRAAPCPAEGSAVPVSPEPLRAVPGRGVPGARCPPLPAQPRAGPRRCPGSRRPPPPGAQRCRPRGGARL